MEVVLSILFLTFSNADIQFVEKELTWRSYTTAEALTTTKQVEFINKKEFAKATLDEKSETFVVHVASFNLTPETYSDRVAQIIFVLVEKFRIPEEYSDFANNFSENKTLVLPERTKLIEHAINLEDDKQPSYRPI